MKGGFIAIIHILANIFKYKYRNIHGFELNYCFLKRLYIDYNLTSKAYFVRLFFEK